MSATRRIWLSAAVGVAVAVLFYVLDKTASLATMVGARPLLMAVGLGAVVSLALLAILAPEGSPKATLEMPKPALVRILAWWAGLAVAFLVIAFASWRQWNLLCLALSIAAMIKTLVVFTYIKRDYQFRVWEPFAAILGCLLFLEAILLFTGRPNVPPPFDAIVQRFGADAAASAAASREAPDLSAAGFSLETKGDVSVGGLPTTFFSFESSSGSRVDVYVSRIVFPLPRGSGKINDPSGWWTKDSHLYTRTANQPVHFVAVGDDQPTVDALVQAYATGG
jgi:hypothetical protein